ncbi:GapR family DNA-binding domain-containing protein [Bacillus sp. OTU2372]|uniref:GapR family DNA-binding domain-containing protein n=1 Tax=Bacillus sp. OTU2372 TaxID=3043858 RepID=UPI00313F29F5
MKKTFGFKKDIMDIQKSDRLRSMLQEALSPFIEKIERLEAEIQSLKEEQSELIKILKSQ